MKIACIAQLVNVIAPIMTQTGGKAWAQTIFYPFMHVSKYGRGSVLQPITASTTHDTKQYTDVPDVDSLAVVNEENGELTVFAVNRDMTDTIPLSVKLINFTNYKPVEYIEMSGYDLESTNTADSSPVVPKKRPLPVLTENALTVKLNPLSWNVIRLKKG